MKDIKNIYLKLTVLLGLIITITVSCEREFSEDVAFATYPATAEIFTDGFMGGLDYFPFGGSYAEAFSVDEDVYYLGSASMRFDIPIYGVGYGGATFPSTGPRDLSGYDALTFWAKATQGADINQIGFGINGDTNNKYQVTLENLPLTTVWTKYVIAIPNPLLLTGEKGMFWYAEGAESVDDEGGYTFWIDELKFEKLGTIAQARPAILDGEDEVSTSFTGTTVELTGLTQTYNLGSGENQTVSIAPSYFTFSSSNVEVARVSELGIVSIVGEGTAIITAQLGSVTATGSLTLDVGGDFEFAPTPTVDSSNVISIFSDTYTDVSGTVFNAYWDYQNTLGGATEIMDQGILEYTIFNYVPITMLDSPINASEMTHIHIDIKTPDTSSAFLIKLADLGDGSISTEDDNTEVIYTVNSSIITPDQWISLDIPLADFNNLPTSSLGYIVLEGTGIETLYVDNIYFYKE